MQKQKILGVERNVFFLGVVSFFNDFSSEMILSIFPAFFKAVLKSGAASLGLVEGIADGTANFIKILSGTFSDRIQRRKKIAVLGYAISVASRPFYLFVSQAPSVIGLRALDRLGKGIREAPRDALISLASQAKEVGASFGFHKAMDSFGAILGPLVAYVILKQNQTNFNTVFVVSFITGLLALATFVFVKDMPALITKMRLSLPSLSRFTGRFRLFLLATLILSCGALPTAVILLRTQDLGFALASIPLFYLVYNSAFTLASFVAGKSADRVGDRQLITLGYLVLIGSYGILLMSTTRIVLIIGFILLGLYAAFTESIQRSYVARTTSQHLRGEAYGLLSAAIGVGSLIAGIVGGLSWEFLGAPFTLVVASLIIIAGLLMLHAPGSQ